MRHALFAGAAGSSAATWVSICERSLYSSMFRARRSSGKDLAPRQGGDSRPPQALPMAISNENCDSFCRPAEVRPCAGNVIASRVTSADTLQVLWNPNPEPVAGYVVYLGQPNNLTQRYDVGDSTTFTWPNAVAGQLYCVQVSAYVDSLEGPRSAQTCGYSNQFPALTNPGLERRSSATPPRCSLWASIPTVPLSHTSPVAFLPV